MILIISTVQTMIPLKIKLGVLTHFIYVHMYAYINSFVYVNNTCIAVLKEKQNYLAYASFIIYCWFVCCMCNDFLIVFERV